MQIESIFPQAVIGFDKLNVDYKKVLKFTENIEFKMTEITEKNECFCFISKTQNILEELPFLKNEIYKKVKHYIQNVIKLKIDFQFTTSWATKTMPNGFSQKHLHSNSFLSGVYYPIGNKHFKIKFYKKNNFWFIETSEVNNLNATWYNFNIIENSLLILFPSHLKHSIEKNLSNETRYSIAFNTLPLGIVGTNDNNINFK